MDYLQNLLRAVLRIEEAICELNTALQQSLQPGPDSEVVTDLNAHKWMDRNAVIHYLQISERTFFRLKKQGIIHPHRIGGRDYYYKPELAAALGLSMLKGHV